MVKKGLGELFSRLRNHQVQLKQEIKDIQKDVPKEKERY